MRKLFYTIMLLTVSVITFGQAFDHLLESIEQNNPRLIALQKWLEAEETKVKTGIYPDNPEINYNYLFGNSQALGNQQELEITQAFKLPGYYTSKSAVQKLNFQQKQALVEQEKKEILHSARQVYFNLVWLQKKDALLKKRIADAENLVVMMNDGFKAGEISKPAYDKVRLYAISIKTENQKVLSEIEVQTQYLSQFNGGNLSASLNYDYPVHWLLPELDSLLANLTTSNPKMVMAKLSVEQSEMEIKNQKMNNLPSFQVGYMSETILDQKLQGVHLSVSIPLWQNKNTVKYAKLNTEAFKANASQQESQLKTTVMGLFYEAKAMRENYLQMKSVMDEEQISESSLELLHSGQISFTEYLVNADLIWQTQNQFYQNEYEYFELLSRLKMFE